jgi:hypothetical protein
MSNTYFTHDTRLTAGVTARASDVNSIFDSVEQGFDLLPSVSEVKYATSNFVDATGTNNYVASFSPALASYIDGMEVTVRVANTNTLAATLNTDGLGARLIYRSDGSNLGIGDILAGAITMLRYDAASGSFRIVSNLPALANEAAASAEEASVWAQQANPTGFIELYRAALTNNVTVAPDGHNGLSVGPLVVANDVTVTVSEGATWTIV